MLKLEYCGLNGVIVETKDCIYVMDYTVGELPSHYLISNKPKIFLVSRNSIEHFSSSILSYKFPIIASYDFESERFEGLQIVSPFDTLHLGFSKISVLPTTRRGVCYVVKERDQTFFFGGDFNLWHWPNMYSETQVHEEFLRFYSVIKEIKKFSPLHLAIMSVNPIMKVDMARGAREFIAMIKPKNFMPIAYKDVKSIEVFELWSKTQLDSNVLIIENNKSIEIRG